MMSDQNYIKLVSVKDKNFWIEFIAIYRNSPCLWDVTHDEYTNKISRDKALQDLLEKAKEMFPNANKEFVKKKIINLRSCFCREYKKIKNSKMINNSTMKLYQTNLWYYNELLFLKENKMNIEDENSSLTVNESIEGEDIFKSEYQITSPLPIPTQLSEPEPNYAAPKVKKIKKCKSQQEQQNCDHVIENEYDIIGKRLSFQLKKMEERQRLIAEKLIGEIMFYGQTKQLKDNTTINLETNITQTATPLTLSYISQHHIQNLSSHFEPHSSSISNKDEPSDFVSIN